MKQESQKISALPPRAAGTQRAQIVSLIDDDTVLVRMHHAAIEELVRAELAVAAYTPQVDDWVLIAGDGVTAYITGVLGAARRRSVTHPFGRDLDVLELRANGRLVLSAPDIRITGAQLDATVDRAALRAQSADLEVDRLVERTHSSYRFTADVASHSAGRMRACVDGAFEVQAERASIVSEGDSVIDGARVLLG